MQYLLMTIRDNTPCTGNHVIRQKISFQRSNYPWQCSAGVNYDQISSLLEFLYCI